MAVNLDDPGIVQFIFDIQASRATVELSDEATDDVVPSDPDDGPMVATAVAGQADVLCRWDRHLRHPSVRSYCETRGIRILTDVELLAVLREADPQGQSEG
ncbi:MAG: hypothetical protein ACKV0T_08875 [Planctomycetales bacterium]